MKKRTLDRLISQVGLASRTEARDWIRDGRVTVDGLPARDPERWVDPEMVRVAVDGKPLRAAERAYLALHKPEGYVTTWRDPEGRPTVYALLKGWSGWVAPVGRLDRETSGLLLLTNDPNWADRVTSPACKIPKTYRVRARGGILPADVERLRRGVPLSDGPTRPARVAVISANPKRTILEIDLLEGRNRQVRRMLRAVGSKVLTLERTAIGPVTLAELEPGAWRKLAPQEIRALGGTRGRSQARTRNAR